MTQQRQIDRALTANTAVNIGLVAVLMGVVFSGARWATTVEYKIDAVRLEIEALRGELEVRMADRWTGAEAFQVWRNWAAWARELATDNPGLNVPTPPEWTKN